MAEGWARRLPPPGDMAAAAVLLVAMTAVRLGAERETDAPLAAVLALSAVIAAGVALRRRAPLTAYALGSAGLAAEALWVGPGPLTPVANLIGVYSLGLYATPFRALLGAPGVLAYFAPKDDSSVTPVAVVCVWLLVWGAGRATARRREEMAELLRREAVVAERVRIAREVHDVLGHSLNAMLVQAGAGRLVLDTDPARTRELLLSVERTGRDALTELDHLLGLLRAEDDEDAEDAEPGATTDAEPGAESGAGADALPCPPNPDPADLARLIRPLADAGMDIRLHIEPETGTLPRAIRLSVHRIVQEALTNALRHGHARSAEVTVRTEPSEPSVRSDRSGRAVLVRIVDGGEGPDPGYRPGRGLRGITERAVAFGGSVSHGPADGGGFTLSVELPLP
ncbi:sensor histidine kinase [Streptomyces neyagawaensis]|uniref:sensor histidine kinase n=1 Tax=Streptomyces neyagawaensis TaxID=42238 RepID=UPI0006E45A18|nr:histidine kinase [Streptomyces neyagawaensis]MCL6731837.1 histidine kinase [Streptomyces neyagawaensis]MDE1683394.1 histidine kinase [Streptomyces neyagawaensis]